MFFALPFAIHHDACACPAWIGRNKIGMIDQESAPVVQMDRKRLAGVFVLEDLLDGAHFVLFYGCAVLSRNAVSNLVKRAVW